MDSNTQNQNIATEENALPAWAAQLEMMRKQRSETPELADISEELPAENIPTMQEEIKEPKKQQEPQIPPASHEEKQLSYKTYLKQWQQEHNINLSQETDDDSQVLFEEEWLHMNEDILLRENNLESEQKLLLKPNEETTPSSPEKKLLTEDLFDNQSVPNLDKTVQITVVRPPIEKNYPISLISEKDLISQLTEKLLPHLNDAVSGMVRTEIQKYNRMMLKDLQDNLQQQIPDMVNDVLQHHLGRILRNTRKNNKSD